MAQDNSQDISKLTAQGLNISQIEMMQNIEKQNKEKEARFKDRISAFKDITSLDEARELANKILPVAQEMNKFRVGNAKCVIINKPERLRISYDSDGEFIAYDFE